jgi:hypothetical protein
MAVPWPDEEPLRRCQLVHQQIQIVPDLLQLDAVESRKEKREKLDKRLIKVMIDRQR